MFVRDDVQSRVRYISSDALKGRLGEYGQDGTRQEEYEDKRERRSAGGALRLPYGRRTGFDRNVPFSRRLLILSPNMLPARGSFANRHPTLSISHINAVLLCLSYV